MFGLSNFIITEFLLIFYSLVTNVLYSYKQENPHLSIYPNNVLNMHISDINLKDEDCYNENILLRLSLMPISFIKVYLQTIIETLIINH